MNVGIKEDTYTAIQLPYPVHNNTNWLLTVHIGHCG